MMTLAEWVRELERLRLQYIEEAITLEEYFNMVVFFTMQVK